jgi:trehalose 6-phosphate synthase/phosphatase
MENESDAREHGQGEPRVLLDERLLPGRFLIASNRLPYALKLEDGEVVFQRGAGGLVTALDPIISHTGGVWIGWTGSYDQLPEKVLLKKGLGSVQDYELKPLNLTQQEVEHYYLGHSNRGIWPLFHYFQQRAEFNREQWQTYQAVNRKFADAIIAEYREGDLVWVHDYHLMLVPAMLREALPDALIGFFLHIPFPSVEILQVDPHAEEILRGLLGADLVGFHIDRYAHNFMDAVAGLTDHRYRRGEQLVEVGQRAVKVGSFPISIDFKHFADIAAMPETEAKAQEIRDHYQAKTIALGVDRLDYTKGILERLEAIELMLEKHPELQGNFTFIQISAPSRTKVHAYQQMREGIEQMVGRITGRFGGKGGAPVDYRYHGYPQEELVAFYRAADLALVTPLRDGMNLVAKEYAASRVDEDGALVISKFAGAYGELRGAIVVNPYDIEGMAESIYQAVMLDREEKRRRMQRLRKVVSRNDIYWWLERFLREVASVKSNA